MSSRIVTSAVEEAMYRAVLRFRLVGLKTFICERRLISNIVNHEPGLDDVAGLEIRVWLIRCLLEGGVFLKPAGDKLAPVLAFDEFTKLCSVHLDCRVTLRIIEPSRNL